MNKDILDKLLDYKKIVQIIFYCFDWFLLFSVIRIVFDFNESGGEKFYKNNGYC